MSEGEDLGCHHAFFSSGINSPWEPCLQETLYQERVLAPLKLLENSSLTSLCLMFLPPKHRLYHKPSSAPGVQLMPTRTPPAQLVLAMYSSACIAHSSCPSPCHLCPGDLFVPSCCHILIYAIAADGRPLSGCSASGALYFMAKVITGSKEQEVNSRLLSSAWTRHKFPLGTTVQAAAS